MKILVCVLVLLSGCTGYTWPVGPASLQIVPPGYYSISVRAPQKYNKPPAQQRYYYPSPGNPVLIADEPNVADGQQQQKLDEAAQKLFEIKRKLNTKQSAEDKQKTEAPKQ
jgi:hypothetical protein